jgi:hypothetical protein
MDKLLKINNKYEIKLKLFDFLFNLSSIEKIAQKNWFDKEFGKNSTKIIVSFSS